MRARHASLLGLLVAACSQAPAGSPSTLQLAPSLLFPQGLLQDIQSIHVNVYGATSGVACSTSTASSTGIPTGPSPLPTPLAEVDLTTTGCAGGASFCGTLPLTESTAPLVFSAVGKGSTGSVIANGCTSVAVTQEAATVAISMVRYIPPAMCGNGVVEVGETCDPGMGSDPLCKNCQTSEIELSPASTYAGGPSAPAPGERGNPFFVWPAASGDGGDFFAFFTDHTGSPTREQVSMSVLGGMLQSVTDISQAVEGGASLFLPNDPNTFPPQPIAGDQSRPSAAVVGSTYFVAFEDDNTTPPNGIDVHLRSMDASLSANQGPGAPCGINGPTGAGEQGIQSAPQIAAGTGGALFVVWQDESLTTVNGVLYTPPAGGTGCGTLGTQVSFGAGQAPSLAATPSGWVVAWQNGSVVNWQAISASGAPTGSPAPVGTLSGAQSLPAVAASTAGGFAIVWASPSSASSSAIFAQRFDMTGTAITGDSGTPVNNLNPGPETSPTIAFTSAAGGSYVVAWVDSGSPNQVRSRLMASSGGSLGDGSAYLFNTIDGQADEFQVSVTAGRARANPTVVVGGSGPYIAYGWEDQSAASGGALPGIIGRRFPPPAMQ